ncbi:MAG: T9SS type A sorting domain-containing protein [Sphingobacteriales bacterium JAD_PAG50586_3]|nr:MAG: T9SS type A sorting domain-containing protein [Sphingobacteriales bacterium JAD_PAG50586_3]
MKRLLLIAAIIITGITTLNAQCIPGSNYNDSLPGLYPNDFPPLIPGQPYNETMVIHTIVDTVVDFQGITIVLNVQSMRLLDITGLPPGFTFESNDSTWLNTGIAPNYTSVVGCFTISANAAAVDAAIAASNGGTGIIDINVYFDLLMKGNPIPATYTWASTLGTPPYGAAFNIPSSIGGNVGGGPWNGCNYNLSHNGVSTYYAGLPSNSGSYQIQLDTYGQSCEWYVTGFSNWATITPEWGTGDATLTVTYDANATGDERYANFSIGNQDYLLTQISDECNVVMSIDTSFIGPLEGTIYVTVDAADSCFWSILNRNQFCDWVDVNPVQGTGSGTIEISYNANNSTDARQCEININGTTITLNQTTVGLNENTAGKIQLYPNPAADLVNINLPLAGKNTLSIYNTAGQLIIQQQLTAQNNQINTAGLANGMYLFVVQNDDAIVARQRVAISR